MMANPSDPETSEDKESGSNKQKAVTKQLAGGSAQEITANMNDTKVLDDNSLRHSEMLDSGVSLPESSFSHLENDGNISYKQLPSSDLSIDARACRRPRRRTSKEAEKSEKTVPIKDVIHLSESDEKEMLRVKSGGEENKKVSKQEEMENFIKQMVHGQVSDIKFFDAAIVYDKNDYENVMDFKQRLVDISKAKFKENLRIELFDSEEFVQSKIMVVEDVLKKCSVIFVYLTSNFTSAELNLFIEEAIGISRLGLGTEQYSFQSQWVLKPVHTEPRKTRTYKTPVGLLTVNGIDWFDRHSEHTLNNVIGILKTAITQRKQREMETNTSNSYKTLIGDMNEMPQLGPPFNKPKGSPNFSQFPVQRQTDPSVDMMSFYQRSLPSQPLPVHFTNIRTDTQPSYMPDFHAAFSYADQFHMNQQSGNFNAPSDMMTQLTLERGRYQMPPAPYSSVAQQQHIRQPQAVGQRIGQTYTAQPEYVHHHSFENLEQRFHANQAVGQLPNYHTETMQQVQSPIMPTQMEADISRVPVYPPNLDLQRQSSNDHYPSMYVSQDAFQSQSGNFHISNDSILPSRVGVHSQPSGSMTSSTNLSADDDVEVDNNTKYNADIDDRSRHSQHDDHDDDDDDDELEESGESSAESDSSSDSDSDCFEGARVVEKVVKIYKCKNVQLGEGNVVKEAEKIPVRKNEKMKKRPQLESRKLDECLGHAPVTDLPQNVLSKPGMNISVSEDNMSMGNVASEGPCYIAENIASPKTTLISKNTSNTTQTPFESGSNRKEKPETCLKMSVGNRDTNSDVSYTFTNVFSPDDNFTEDQLFGSGSLSSNLNQNGPVCSAIEAPFSFSQGIQQSRDIRKLLQPLSIDKQKTTQKMFENNSSVDREELD